LLLELARSPREGTNLCERVGATVRGKVRITVNATLKTAVAISIVIAGAIVIYEALHQDSWWYGSGLAMGWGAMVSWARNLV
jgi:hypothetical protein